MNHYTETTIEKTISEDGSIQISEVEKTTKFKRNEEPDYIKIYTKMWLEFNQVPERYHMLFLNLACRMTYCDSTDMNNSQIVYTGEPVQSAIMKACGWQTRDPYLKGLKALCDCNAIKKINRSVYQINPEYAGKGEWKYNPKLNRGGVEDLVAIFKFKDKKVHTEVVWSDTAEDDQTVTIPVETTIKKGESFSVKETTIDDFPDQLSFDDVYDADGNLKRAAI